MEERKQKACNEMVYAKQTKVRWTITDGEKSNRYHVGLIKVLPMSSINQVNKNRPVYS